MTNNTLLPLSTASCYTSSVKASLKRPLLLDSSNHTKPCWEDSSSCFQCRPFVAGTGIGFVIQLIALSASTYSTMIQWYTTTTTSSPVEECLLLRLLGQLDTVLYFLVWINFTFSMTQFGSDFWRRQLTRYSSSRCDLDGEDQWTRKSVFAAGLNVIVGVVLGSFLAFALGYVVILGASPITLLPMLYTLLVDLVLCYIMALCYDWETIWGLTIDNS